MPRSDPAIPTSREPILHTVGMREVRAKRQEWRARTQRNEAEFLGQHMIPVILGPKERPYVIDHPDRPQRLHLPGMGGFPMPERDGTADPGGVACKTVIIRREYIAALARPQTKQQAARGVTSSGARNSNQDAGRTPGDTRK